MSNHAFANDNPRESGAERRRSPRRRVLFQGKTVYPHNSFSADCVIRNPSDGGARITLAPEALSPAPFLIVGRDSVVHKSLTVWTNPHFTGLRFQESQSLNGDVPPHMRAIQKLWLELAPR